MRHPRSASAVVTAATLALALTVGAGLAWPRPGRGRAGLVTVGDAASIGPSAPAPGAEEASKAPFAYLVTGPGHSGPARWNPCAPIRYVVNLTAAPPQGRAELDEALAQVSAATGFRFIAVGSTRAVPGRDNPPEQAQAIIGWVTAEQLPALTKGVVGYGGGSYEASRQGPDQMVEGFVAINGPDMATLRPGFGPGITQGELLLHELGHMMGLAHVDHPSEVMYPDINPRSQGHYQAGDLAGLARLGTGSGRCLTPA